MVEVLRPTVAKVIVNIMVLYENFFGLLYVGNSMS